ncbi:MAG: hypothetical protein HY899_07965 [Deltaproteobacteria bacterium]|nr:hypothetical protein [Deltaproteobacteria bacterium]
MKSGRRVTVVSHGPNCLDGLACAVVAARYFAGRPFHATFASNRAIDEVLQKFNPERPNDEELWITDISWRSDETTDHLNDLVDQGLELYWVDHHKTALEARERGRLQAAFTGFVLDMSYSASRLLFEYLSRRTAERGESRPGLLALRNLVLTADDVDRWVLQVEGSRELALTVRAMDQQEAYKALLAMDSNLTYGTELRRARDRVERELQATLLLANATCRVRPIPARDLTVIAAECDGYAGEIADRWRERYRHGIFALYDRRGGGISLRRTPDCSVDLSRLAGAFGGGGHEAAAGCEVEVPGPTRAATLMNMVVEALERGADTEVS